MRKSLLVACLITAAAGTLHAEDRIKMASIDPDTVIPKKYSILPPLVSEKYEYYDVCGCTEREMSCDLQQKAVMCDDGRKYDSVTSWSLKWDYGHDRTSRECSADSFRVSVEILYKYPRWARNGDVPARLADKWERYLKNLTAHENGHRNIVVDAAGELTRTVTLLPPAPSCADLDKTVAALSREQMKKMNLEQKEYDAETNHGRTQGAVFP